MYNITSIIWSACFAFNMHQQTLRGQVAQNWDAHLGKTELGKEQRMVHENTTAKKSQQISQPSRPTEPKKQASQPPTRPKTKPTPGSLLQLLPADPCPFFRKEKISSVEPSEPPKSL